MEPLDYVYLVTEWDELQGPSTIIGVFNKIELLNSTITQYFGGLLLFHEGEPVTTEDIERLLLVLYPLAGDECLIILKDETGNAAMIYKLIQNHSRFSN